MNTLYSKIPKIEGENIHREGKETSILELISKNNKEQEEF